MTKNLALTLLCAFVLLVVFTMDEGSTLDNIAHGSPTDATQVAVADDDVPPSSETRIAVASAPPRPAESGTSEATKSLWEWFGTGDPEPEAPAVADPAPRPSAAPARIVDGALPRHRLGIEE